MPLPTQAPTETVHNCVPEWLNGTFVWRLNLPNTPDALEQARCVIASVANLLDNSLRQVIIMSGAIGMDTGMQSWDGSWPYLLRPSYRINYDWEYLATFMRDMRDHHNTLITFHTNITDANGGLAHSEETQQFFERLRDARCIYTRAGGSCGEPYTGPAFVPTEIQTETPKMPYVEAGDASDIFAVVDYLRFWESGIAKEQFDTFFAHLPYVPPMLYCDVLSFTGNNLCVGYPDGLLGHSKETQLQGIEQIIDYLRGLGCDVGGEGPLPYCRYNWNHGGLATNDYYRVSSGYAQGCATANGIETMHVYGNQGAYSIDLSGTVLGLNIDYVPLESGGTMMVGVSGQNEDVESSDPTREWRGLKGVIDGFYQTVIQELYHVGLGSVRLPGGRNTTRLDEREGNVELAEYVISRNKFSAEVVASSGELLGSCTLAENSNANSGSVVTGMNQRLFSGNIVAFKVPENGEYTLLIRYFSDGGGRVHLVVNDATAITLDLPDTGGHLFYSDYTVQITLNAGQNRLRLYKGAIYAAWSDGVTARWDEHGFYTGEGDVVLGRDGARMWPDTWSGEQKIYFYSQNPCDETWILPTGWDNLTEAKLYPLTDKGRGESVVMNINCRSIKPSLQALTPYVLIVA